MNLYKVKYNKHNKVLICALGYTELLKEIEKRNIYDIDDIEERKCLEISKEEIKKELEKIDNEFDKCDYIINIQKKFIGISRAFIDKEDNITLDYYHYTVSIIQYSDSLLLSI